MIYEIISTGSQGNAAALHKVLLIDCGVSFKALRPFVPALKLVLLTHIHSDHFNRRTIRLLAEERPMLRFGCGPWLAGPLSECGVAKTRIDVLDPDTQYGYGFVKIIPVRLRHNVPNMGYKLLFPGGKVFYATDTSSLDGIEAKGYDLYLVEANYGKAEIRDRISRKKAEGEYAYELEAMKNHLSVEKCNDWLYRNMGPGSEYVYLHAHREGGGSGCGKSSLTGRSFDLRTGRGG